MSPTDSARSAAPEISARQRRGIRRTTWAVSLLALAVYFGYMIVTFMHMHR